MRPAVSAVIVHFGSVDYTAQVVRRLQSFAGPDEYEIIVVDNAAETPFPGGDFPRVHTLRLEENSGYGAACNHGAAASRGRNIFILNNDLDFPENPLPALLGELAAHPRCGAVGPALRFPDGRFQLSWGDDPTLLAEFRERRRQLESRGGGGEALRKRETDSRRARAVDWITGACMLIPREAWDTVGGFDEAYFFYFEDVDLCRRLRRAGYEIRYLPDAEVVHFGGGSSAPADPRIMTWYRREQLRYYARNNSPLSFVLLKRYLLWKFARMRRSGAITGDDTARLRDMIRGFSRRRERSAFFATQRNMQ